MKSEELIFDISSSDECEGFRNLCLSIMNAAGTDSIFFSDAVEISQEKHFCALGFYHLLCLVSQRKFNVMQKESFGPILISE